MLPRPRYDLVPNTREFETVPLVEPLGFREYDARWLFPEQLNLLGAQAVGTALGCQLREKGSRAIAVAHDYRAYSNGLKQALTLGLVSAGCDVFDIGLAVTPMAYYAQFDLGVNAVAMVTASHNENGWTGIKIGAEPPLTFGPDEMARLKALTLSGEAAPAEQSGSYRYVPDFGARYLAEVVGGTRLKRPLKVVVACGNGTAGLFAPDALAAIGCEVVPLHCSLDHTFPNYNPNPEDMAMLHDVAAAVRGCGADLGLAFDGDGDRCGVVDETGAEIFADKMGLLIARDLAATHPGASFVIDVKSTGLFRTDAALREAGATVHLGKTGHSYMKRAVRDLQALAGFEKSGHYIFAPPLGRGYDDGIVSAVMICRLLDRNPGMTLSTLKDSLPRTWLSPTMSPYCPDDRKYAVVDQISRDYQALAAGGGRLLDQPIEEVITINGVRVGLADGTWGLIRASSNKPSLVVVVESPVSEQQMHAMFAELDGRLRAFDEVGAYDQTI